VVLADEPADTVVIQSPKPGKGAGTPRVDFLVAASARENSYVMPHYIGLNELEVSRRIDQAHLRYRVQYVNASQWPKGTVIDQTPLSGSRIGTSAEVELTVAN
jgi:beta-lactam-binding protein with PASTA domain